METLRLKPRPPVSDVVENWDDDDFDIEGADLSIQSHSIVANLASSRRESHSSFRSDLDSAQGEEEKQFHLPGDDEKSTLDAIAAATKAGIPLPKNVPSSALTGGTIKRLGGRKLKKIIQDDWDEDLVLPETGHALQIKPQDGSKFPDVLRQVSNSAHPSPSKSSESSLPLWMKEGHPAKAKKLMPAIDLDRFRDTEEDEDLFGDGISTIKVAKKRDGPKPIPLITPPTPQKKAEGEMDDFEVDLELPSDGKLKLSKRRDIPKTPSLYTLDELDWAEGSLGTRFGGTRRDGRSNRSSSVSALSPSVTSSITAESEDEALDGLILPQGPLDFNERLRRKRVSRSPERIPEEPANLEDPPKLEQTPRTEPEHEDFLDGLDIGEGDVFRSKKPTLHRNVQLKETRPASPSRPKTAVTLKFTTKPTATSRLPRPMGPIASHERMHTQPSLEPVSESGGPITHTRRSLSRMGHSAQSSIASLSTPTTSSFAQPFLPSTPRKRELGHQTSTTTLRNEPTTTSSQLLRFKRSLPSLNQSPARPISSRPHERPPSRTESAARPQLALRPKTPVERHRIGESAVSQARKAHVPFLPAGASASQSHNVNARNSRTFRRHESTDSVDFRPSSRAISRSTVRSPSPRKQRQAEKATHEGPWQQLNKPRRVRHFGNGHELDGFDDLPTSTQAEATFMKQPVCGVRTQVRNPRLYQTIVTERTGTPSPLTPRGDQVPNFARDTAASRMARESSMAQRAGSTGPLAPLTSQRIAQLSSRSNLNPSMPQSTPRSRKPRKAPQLKPHLISNLNPPKESKSTSNSRCQDWFRYCLLDRSVRLTLL